MTDLVRRGSDVLQADPGRIVSRFFQPGDSTRIEGIIRRILTMTDEQVTNTLAATVDGFSDRHDDLAGLFAEHFARVASHVPGTVSAGFNMSILPHVLANGTVLLQFSTDISALNNIREVQSGTSKIETPEIDTRNFLQRVAMKSNETLIISGFEQTDDNLDRRGPGSARNVALGGGVKAASAKESIVILITPTTVGL